MECNWCCNPLYSELKKKKKKKKNNLQHRKLQWNDHPGQNSDRNTPDITWTITFYFFIIFYYMLPRVYVVKHAVTLYLLNSVELCLIEFFACTQDAPSLPVTFSATGSFKPAAVASFEVHRLSIQTCFPCPCFPKQMHWDTWPLEVRSTSWATSTSDLQWMAA